MVQQVELAQLSHKHQKPKYLVQKIQSHVMHQNQNIVNQIRINEYQKNWVDLMKAHQFVDHGIIQDPSIPSAKLQLKNKDTR